jgi:hypothetical protein
MLVGNLQLNGGMGSLGHSLDSECGYSLSVFLFLVMKLLEGLKLMGWVEMTSLVRTLSWGCLVIRPRVDFQIVNQTSLSLRGRY